MVVRYRLVPLFIFLCIISCGSGEKTGPDLISDEILSIERWPGEGLPVIAWTGAETLMNVYASPGDTTPADGAPVIQNQPLKWDESLIIVRATGRMKILEDCIIDGFVYDSLKGGKLGGGRPRQLNFSSGMILEVICYTAEGYYIFRLGDEFIEMEASLECQQMVALPETEWWVRIEENGRPVGWVRADGEDISEVDREF